MSGYHSNQEENSGYNTMPGRSQGGFVISGGGGTSGGPQLRQGRGGQFRIVMPQPDQSSRGAPSPQVIHIGPAGVRSQGGGPSVRVLERQPSGHMRIISGGGAAPVGSVQVKESPYSTMRQVQVERPETSPHGVQPGVRVIPISRGTSVGVGQASIQSGQPGVYRINMVPGGGAGGTPTPPANVYVSSSAPFHDTQEPQIYYSRKPAEAPGTPGTPSTGSPFHTAQSRDGSPFHTAQSGDGSYPGSLQRVVRVPLVTSGRSQSMDSGGTIVVGAPAGQTVYTSDPGGIQFDVSGSGVQPDASETPAPDGRAPVFYVRTNSGGRQASSPKVQVTRIQDALDSRRQRPHNFDDIIQKKIINFLQGQGQQPQQVPGTQQYLFRHQPQAEESNSRQTPPKREEYIFVSRPRDVTPPQVGTERRDSSGTAVRPGKKIVRTTREVIRDIGGGQMQTTRETHEELVDDDSAEAPSHAPPQPSTPVVQTEDSDTWKSTSSNDSGTGSGDRDMFKKFRFKFDSIGPFHRSESRESTAGREQFHFQDFDDMVGRMNNLRVPVISQVHQEAPQHAQDVIKVKAICPHCKNTNPGAVKTSSPTQTDSEPQTGGQTHGQTTLQVPSSTPSQHGPGHPLPGVARPKSFLREEMDEFDRIFSELLSPRGKPHGLGFAEADSDSDVTPDATLVGGVTSLADSSCDTDSDVDAMKCRASHSGAKSCDQSCDRCGQIRTRELRAGGASPSKLVPNRCLSCPADPSLTGGATGGSDGNQGDPVVSRGTATVIDDNDKLFTQLLDDLDNITGDTPSVRRRKKARDLFSNWLFSEDSKSPENTPVLRCKEAYRQLTRRRSADLPQTDQPRHNRHNDFSKWRPRSFEYLSEDDADSGYHTGCSTLQSRGPKGTRNPGEWTLTREDLRRGIESFNANNHGLIMSLQSDTNTFQGFIRVHMNLIRPINMSLSTRPTSIYDVVGQGEDEEEFIDGPEDTQITSFYLPKDTTKVIHINSDTTTQEVIKALLSKFKITDNPRKFALYEKVLESDKKATMRKMEEEECPLPLCLCWTSDGIEGLDCRKFVLQENDAGEIMWEAFSLPELENFLRILNREEEEYVEQVKGKYRMLRIHMQRRQREIQDTRSSAADPKRKPVFV